MYTNLKIDIPTSRNVFIEKFIKPYITNEHEIEWRDKNEELHSFNGFPACIDKRKLDYILGWYNHGICIKLTSVEMKSQSEIIAEKIANRNFAGRAKKK